MKNIEIKAKISDYNKFENEVKKICGAEGKTIKQEDIFFFVPKGRLKLRIFTESSGELIYYERENTDVPKESNYFILVTDEPEKLKSVLQKSLGIRGTVKKIRQLYLYGNTRIHVDEVENLGNYLELEVVLKNDQSTEEGIKIANDLMLKLGINQADLINNAYIDLIEAKAKVIKS